MCFRWRWGPLPESILFRFRNMFLTTQFYNNYHEFCRIGTLRHVSTLISRRFWFFHCSLLPSHRPFGKQLIVNFGRNSHTVLSKWFLFASLRLCLWLPRFHRCQTLFRSLIQWGLVAVLRSFNSKTSNSWGFFWFIIQISQPRLNIASDMMLHKRSVLSPDALGLNISFTCVTYYVISL